MSNTRAGNVVCVDTDGGFTDVTLIRSIKYIGASGGAVTIKKGSSSGNPVWEASGTSNTYDADVNIVCPTGIYVDVTSGGKVYLYLP